jgi:hypothetical protein
MKLFNAFVGLAIIADPTDAAKTPYRRRLQKTFDLLSSWKDANLANHPHSTLVRADKDNKTKFDFKFQRLTNKIYDMYEARIIEIAQGCPDTSTCDEYLDCTGEGDRMNTVRGRPAVELSDAYLDFVKDKWNRSKSRVFDNDVCGFKPKMVANINDKVLAMVDAFKGWRLQCRKFTGDNCPLHCQKIERNDGDRCGPK